MNTTQTVSNFVGKLCVGSRHCEGTRANSNSIKSVNRNYSLPLGRNSRINLTNIRFKSILFSFIIKLNRTWPFHISSWLIMPKHLRSRAMNALQEKHQHKVALLKIQCESFSLAFSLSRSLSHLSITLSTVKHLQDMMLLISMRLHDKNWAQANKLPQTRAMIKS